MAKKLIREMRKAAIKLYGEKCVYCDGDKNLTADHLLPRSLHGSSHLINIVISCAACNLQKDNKLPSELSLPDSIVTKIRTVQEKLLPSFQQANLEREKRGIPKLLAFLFVQSTSTCGTMNSGKGT